MSYEDYSKIIALLIGSMEIAESERKFEVLPELSNAIVNLVRCFDDCDSYYTIKNLKEELKKYKENSPQAE